MLKGSQKKFIEQDYKSDDIFYFPIVVYGAEKSSQIV